MKFSIEVDPAEVLEFLQLLADEDGTSHKVGPNSKVKTGETVVPILKKEGRDAHS
jgi:hypothetical protein